MAITQLITHPGEFAATVIAPFLHGILTGNLGLSETTYHVITAFLMANVMAIFVSLSAFWMIYMERKVCARFQNRVGPNRVGPKGLLQTIADAVKLLQKEDLIPRGADRAVFILAPFVAFAPVYMVLAVIPFDKGLSVTDLNLGMLYITAVSGMGVLSIVMAGWSSNNKYSLLGGLRSAAQLVSYELSPALVVLSVVLFTGTLSTQGIVEAQANNWNLFAMGPMGLVGLMIYLTASTAEINRAPFDMPEAESELTAGFSTEYSGMRFSFFYLAEFINMFIISALLATMFLGGWQPLAMKIPYTETVLHFGGFIPGWLLFMLKTYAVIFVIMWFRWTFPRVRVDQLMKLEWKILLPISFVNLICVAVFMALNWGPK
ncbi:MAG: NADH-quinone oxidoreductase subunit NuoH [candidate division FCPU426 bacterium]